MKRNINGFEVVWNKGYDRHTDEGIIIASRMRLDGTSEVYKSAAADNIMSFVNMLKSKKVQ